MAVRFAAVLVVLGLATVAQAADYPLTAVPFTDVQLLPGFWASRVEVNREVTLDHTLERCRETGRIDNFAVAAGRLGGRSLGGRRFDDSDVFKVLEGAAYVLASRRDRKLEQRVDELIELIAAAQGCDGYLFTHEPALPAGKRRWEQVDMSHELYNVGHLYEAAVAYFEATGKPELLYVAIRNADLVADTFGPGRRCDVPGHQEIELGLVRLFRVTHDPRYLELARFFLDERGLRPRNYFQGIDAAYIQDHAPVVKQDFAVGHAVRAMYMYAAMVDVGVLTGSSAHIAAAERIWADIVASKTYLTGGLGARRSGESFGRPYELPADGYAETCAAIGGVLLHNRLFLLHGDGRYVDALERVLYNGLLSGVSLRGDQFFYPNPLVSDGESGFNYGKPVRQEWFDTACCPSNVVRFVPRVGDYVYASRGRDVYVNLYVASSASLDVDGLTVRLTQETDYPWSGDITIRVDVDRPIELALRLRIPGWARGAPVPSDLYVDLETAPAEARISVDGASVSAPIERSFAVVRRRWIGGERIRLELPMAARRVVAHDAVESARGRVALERGPLVYAVEGMDHGGRVTDLILPDTAVLRERIRPGLLGGVTVIEALGERAGTGRSVPITAIPYYAWAHRGADSMTVWMPRANTASMRRGALARESVPSASHVNPGDSLAALNDIELPSHSGDLSVSRFTWWDRRGSREWAEYRLPNPTVVAGASVYWFDDRPNGGCRVPVSWRLLYRSRGAWRPVTGVGEYATARDRLVEVTFDAVETDAVRLEVQLAPGFSGGVLEWWLRREGTE